MADKDCPLKGLRKLQGTERVSALHGRYIIVTRLLEVNGVPNRYNPPGANSPCTPLHSAAFAGHLDTVKALVEGGARLDIGDIHQEATVLDWAQHAGHSNIVAYLASRQ